MGNLTSNSTLHGQLTNEIQTGVTIARSHDAFGSLGWGDFNAEAQSRREFECQLVVYSALVADKAATSGQNSTFSFSHSPFACAPTNRHPYTVSYAYDHRGRMVKKEIRANDGSDTLVKSTTYLWDGWNIIREIQWPVASDQWSVETLATSHYPLATDYVWGLDLDGTLQGAGGVGGLLAVVRDDGVSLPTYDANGNVSEYVSEDGSIVAHYDYSPFGETLVESGDLASSFTHRFSTKPWCPVTGLCEYQMRKYRPGIGRWLSRDPIGESDSANLLTFVANQLNAIDKLGLALIKVVAPKPQTIKPLFAKDSDTKKSRTEYENEAVDMECQCAGTNKWQLVCTLSYDIKIYISHEGDGPEYSNHLSPKAFTEYPLLEGMQEWEELK